MTKIAMALAQECAAREKAAEALVVTGECLKVAAQALNTLAALDDGNGEAHLKATGSYAAFDNPGAVQVAREALARMAELMP